MKVVILAGGLGSRISEGSHLKPKPMIEIGQKPILWHIMKEYSYYGFCEFIICCGYKQHLIKEWFANYYLHGSDITFDFSNENKLEIHNNVTESWKVTIVDTGVMTQTGGRVKKIQSYINDDTFMLTYGDIVSDINIRKLLEFHQKSKAAATMTVVPLEQRFGILSMDENNNIFSFKYKQGIEGTRTNGGYMVLEPSVLQYITSIEDSFENVVLRRLSGEGKLKGYKHSGFWMPMDTQRDCMYLEELITLGKAPWMK